MGKGSRLIVGVRFPPVTAMVRSARASNSRRNKVISKQGGAGIIAYQQIRRLCREAVGNPRGRGPVFHKTFSPEILNRRQNTRDGELETLS